MNAKLQLSRREKFGKNAKEIVREGNALANIFGKGEDSIAVQAPVGIVEKVVNEAGKNHPIDITLEDGKEILALVDEIERDAVTRRIHHVSFRRIVKGQKVSTEVPIHLMGDAPATRIGLILVNILDHVEVEAIPAKLPDSIEISIESLAEDGDSISVADLVMPEGVELKTDTDQLIAKIDTPRAEVEEEADDEGEVDAADVPSDNGAAGEEAEEE